VNGIEIRHDRERGCGWRKKGGLYLVSDGIGIPCSRLPAPVEVCPTCDQAMHGAAKPWLGWSWIDADAFLSKRNCPAEAARCATCPVITGRQGLLWIGGKYYPTPEDWMREAHEMGVSRRIKVVPKGFEIGKHWVLVARRKGMPILIERTCATPMIDGHACLRQDNHKGEHSPERDFMPAIFHAFKPTAIEYVVKGDETEEAIEKLRKRGITPVEVVIDQPPAEEVA
jgi:hypothetical protein